MTNQQQPVPIHEYTVAERKGSKDPYVLQRDGNLVACPFQMPTMQQNKLNPNQSQLSIPPCTTQCAKAEMMEHETEDGEKFYCYHQNCALKAIFPIENMTAESPEERKEKEDQDGFDSSKVIKILK